jgi:hypothetical protein
MKDIFKIALGGLLAALVLWYIFFQIFPPTTAPLIKKPISQELTQPITPKPTQPPVTIKQYSMDNILELLVKNKEWLFSGIGIFLIVGLFSFLRKLINLPKKKSVPYSEPQNLVVITGPPPSPAIIETKPAPYSPPVNIFQLESLSPTEILKSIREAPLLQQSDVTKHYIGLKITWEGTLAGATEKGDGNVMMVISLSSESIFFYVNKNDYPGLGLLKRGAILKVEGTIESIDSMPYYFTLKDAKIISITPHDAESPHE